MKDFSVSMAIVDYIPVILFATAAVLLMRDLYNKMSKGAFALFAAGVIDIVCAGALKATYKLLYASGVCDFEPLNEMFFPVQSIGFLLAGIGIIAMLCHKQGAACSTVRAFFFSRSKPCDIFSSLSILSVGFALIMPSSTAT